MAEKVLSSSEVQKETERIFSEKVNEFAATLAIAPCQVCSCPSFVIPFPPGQDHFLSIYRP